MRPIRIVPAYTLLLKYDIRPGMHEAYYRYVSGEFVPSVQQMGLYMQDAWQVPYGDYPERQVEFVAEELSTVQRMFDNPLWEKLETRLKEYTENYSRRLILYNGPFRV